MMLEWIFFPGVQYALLGLSMGLCLYLFCTLKIEIRAQDTVRRQNEALFAEKLSELRQSVDALRVDLRETEERTGMLVPPAPPKSGLNLNRRSQALKMYRRGDSPAQIAFALGLPSSEVELLVKVHQIVLDQVTS